jgi:hypothetical protein
MLARGGDVAQVWYFVSEILARASNIQSQRGPLPVSGCFAAEGHSIQCLSGPGRVHVASYMLVLHRPGQGDAVCT